MRAGLAAVGGLTALLRVAHKTLWENTTLREAALASGAVTAEQFDRIVNPAAMVGAISANNRPSGGTDNGSQ